MLLRTSYSSLGTLHSCERKFELTKLVKSDLNREDAPHFSHGHAFGAGVAWYLLTGDKDRAIYECWKAYWPDLREDNVYSPYHSIAILEGAWRHLDKLKLDWEVAYFNGKPAIELKCRINISPEHYHVGHLDVVLKNKKTGMYAVLDQKTTGSRLLDITPMYKNNDQLVGYSIMLDAIVGPELTSFYIMYFVAQQRDKKLVDTEYHPLAYKKTIKDRLNWFITLGMDINHIKEMREMKYFPMRGNHCLAFNKTCSFFGTCQLRKTDEPLAEFKDEVKYDFEFFLDDIVQDHVDRVKKMLEEQAAV